MSENNVGKIVQVIGPVIDVEFDAGHLPEIYNALRVVSDGTGGTAKLDVICEVEQHLGENRVRAAGSYLEELIHYGVTKQQKPVVGPYRPFRKVEICDDALNLQVAKLLGEYVGCEQ